jgi:hypothetical protein
LLLEGFGNGGLGGWPVELPQVVGNPLQLSGHVGNLQGRANPSSGLGLVISIGEGVDEILALVIWHAEAIRRKASERPVDQRPPGRMIVSLLTEQPSREWRDRQSDFVSDLPYD